MVKIEIVESLFNQIEKKFKREAIKVYNLIDSLHDNPKKGKILTSIGGMVIKELKYKNFRFYFITDGHTLKFLSEDELKDLLIRFVRMSDKKRQQETIDEIRNVLLRLGPSGFD